MSITGMLISSDQGAAAPECFRTGHQPQVTEFSAIGVEEQFIDVNTKSRPMPKVAHARTRVQASAGDNQQGKESCQGRSGLDAPDVPDVSSASALTGLKLLCMGLFSTFLVAGAPALPVRLRARRDPKA